MIPSSSKSHRVGGLPEWCGALRLELWGPSSRKRESELHSCGHVAGDAACDEYPMHHSENDLMRLTSGAVVSYGALAVCTQ